MLPPPQFHSIQGHTKLRSHPKLGQTQLERILWLRLSLQPPVYLTPGEGWRGAAGHLPARATNHQDGLLKGDSLVMPLFGKEEGMRKKGEGEKEDYKAPQVPPAALEP